MGIDPGIGTTGYGIIEWQAERARFIDCGVIRTKNNREQGQRLLQLYSGISRLLKRFNPHTLAVEDSFLGKNFLSAKVLGGAKAMALLAGAEMKLQTLEFSPREIKQAVAGRGEASKQQINYMVSNLLSLKTPPQEDSSDALAVALCCAFRSNSMNLEK
jgi:crossover junction endodeoxyribonuclease RuvC